jgi:hypothetical protein
VGLNRMFSRVRKYQEVQAAGEAFPSVCMLPQSKSADL